METGPAMARNLISMVGTPLSQMRLSASVSNMVTEPSTGQVLGTVANFGLDQIRNAIECASTAQAEYFSGTTAASRGALLRKWHDLVMANLEDRSCSITLSELYAD